MESKDIALLGFVSAAQRYVENHYDDGTNLGDLKEIDIKSLKDKLSAELKNLAMPLETKKELINAGIEAFDEYAKDLQKPKHSIIDQLGQTFNPNFNSYDEEAEETEAEINTMMDAYDLDEPVVEASIEKPANDDLDEFGLSSDDDILMKITKAAAKSDEELAREYNQTSIAKPQNMDSTYADVILNEANVDIPNLKPKQANKKVKVQNKSSLSDELKSIGEQEALQVAYQEYLKEKNKKTAPLVSNPGLDIVMQQEEDNKSYHDIVKEKGNREDDSTLSQAIEGLSKLHNREKKTSYNSDPNEDIYNSIMVAYPYLSKNFVKDLYNQKDQIEKGYDTGFKHIIIHRLVFDDIESLREFVEIMMSHDYLVNVDEKKMIVDTIKEFINEEGAILTNIFSIANQAKILKGEYEGYRVMLNEGK